jgi:superfamily II DNA/RNA helicase
MIMSKSITPTPEMRVLCGDAEWLVIEQATVPASENEEKVYSVLSELRAEATKNEGNEDWKNSVLIQYGIYKQFLSSPESCRQTLNKRITAVRKKSSDSPELPVLDRSDSLLSRMSIRESTRYKLLKTQLEGIGWNGSPGSPRVLVFTEYSETRDALAEALAKDFKLKYSSKFEHQPKQVLATINGSCPDIHLMDTFKAFGTAASEMRILLATDLVSEGVNLHHQCHNIIHYDLPWVVSYQYPVESQRRI